MPKRVRIVRKTQTPVQTFFRLTRVIEILLGIGARHLRDARLDYMTQLRAQKIQQDTELARLRQQKVSNDVVLGDLKIEEMRRELGITDTPFSPPSPD